MQLHVKVSAKAQEDNSGYPDRSFHCIMASYAKAVDFYQECGESGLFFSSSGCVPM